MGAETAAAERNSIATSSQSMRARESGLRYDLGCGDLRMGERSAAKRNCAGGKIA